MGGRADDEKTDPNIHAVSPDDVIVQHYKWRWDESRNLTLYRTLGAFSAFSFGMSAFVGFFI